MNKFCIVIPHYNHATYVAQVVQALKPLNLPCWIVDDGSDATSLAALQAMVAQEASWVRLLCYQPNQGKGMAVMTGFAAAHAAGFTHAVQMDADGQHDVQAIAQMLTLSAQQPEAMIVGYAMYDHSVPKARLYGRYATHVWVWINTLSLQIRDAMCGLRVYPLAVTLAVWNSTYLSRRMSFDIEILVRLYWRGIHMVNVPVAVHYPADGISHFKVWRDNVQISAAHARMFFGMLWRAPGLLLRNVMRWVTV